MTPTSEIRSAPHGRRRVLSAALTVGLAAATIVAAGGGTAQAADLPQAQSVGNFLDATVGGMTLDQIAKLEYARAKSPGTQSTQNPLDATALDAIELPLTGALQLPQIAGINLGAVNQVAVAKANGRSYGGSGAVNNSGGASVGGEDGAFPANASIDLCASAISGGKCGTGAGDQLGQVKLDIGAVSGLAQTPKGYGKDGSTDYNIAGLDLTLGSPLLGNLLGQLTTALSGGFSTVSGALKPVVDLLDTLGTVPDDCVLKSGELPTTISIDSNGVNGVVTVDAATGTIKLSLDKLLKSLDLDLNNLPANTDLVKYVTGNLDDILSKGLGGLVNSILGTVGDLVGNCTPSGPLADGLKTLLTTLTGAVSTLTDTVGDALKTVTDALAPLLDVLKNVVDIGVNVQPNGPDGTFTSGLEATPKQGTDVVQGQTIVRAIEVNLLKAVDGGVPLPDLPTDNFAGVRAAAAPGGGLLTLALGNAAAGPSTAPDEPTTTPTPVTTVPGTEIPTGVPAGQASDSGGTPVLPLVAFLAVLGVLGAGIAQYRMRGKYRL